MKCPSILITFSLPYLLLHISLLGMDENTKSKQLLQLESQLADVQLPSQEAAESARFIVTHENTFSSRKFPIYPYEKALEFAEKLAIDDAYENCPSSLKYELDKVAYFATGKLKDKETLKDLVNRIILTGEAGGGKTTLSYAIAYNCRLPFSFVRAPELCNTFKDSCPDIINDLIKPFIKSRQRGLIIIDEASAFIKKMKNKNDPDTGAVEELWTMFDEAKNLNPQLMVILATNKLKYFPKTLLTRFGGSRITINLPSPERRLSIITKFFQAFGGAEDNLLKKIAHDTKDLSLRETNLALCRARGDARIRSELQNVPLKIDPKDIDGALKSFLDEHANDTWNYRKKKLQKIFIQSWPYIYQTTIFAVGTYCAWTMYKAQLEQTVNQHKQSLEQAKNFHTETLELTKAQHAISIEQAHKHHSESLSQATTHHQQSLNQALELHNDNHSWRNGIKHGMANTAGAAIGLAVTATAPLASTLAIPPAAALAGTAAFTGGAAIAVSGPVTTNIPVTTSSSTSPIVIPAVSAANTSHSSLTTSSTAASIKSNTSSGSWCSIL